MATDPTEIHPEHERPTPDNIDDWSGDQIDAYNEAKDAEHDAEAQERQRELTREQKEALTALESATGNDGEVPTAKIQLGEATVTVKRKLSGELEAKFDAISKNRDDLGAIKDSLIDACHMLIVDDSEPDGDPVDFTDREVWEEYHRRHGSEGLADAFDKLSGPAMDRRDDLEFRGEE